MGVSRVSPSASGQPATHAHTRTHRPPSEPSSSSSVQLPLHIIHLTYANYLPNAILCVTRIYMDAFAVAHALCRPCECVWVSVFACGIVITQLIVNAWVRSSVGAWACACGHCVRRFACWTRLKKDGVYFMDICVNVCVMPYWLWMWAYVCASRVCVCVKCKRSWIGSIAQHRIGAGEVNAYRQYPALTHSPAVDCVCVSVYVCVRMFV